MNLLLVASLAFCAGGFVATLLMYPKFKKLPREKRIDIDYLAKMFSFQYWAGVKDGQNNKDLPLLDMEEVAKISTRVGHSFRRAAKVVADRIYIEEDKL